MAGTRKYSKTVALAVNTSEVVRDRLTLIADERDISRADLVNDIINEYLERRSDEVTKR